MPGSINGPIYQQVMLDNEKLKVDKKELEEKLRAAHLRIDRLVRDLMIREQQRDLAMMELERRGCLGERIEINISAENLSEEALKGLRALMSEGEK